MGCKDQQIVRKLADKLKENDSAVTAAAAASLCSLGADSSVVVQALKGDSRSKVATLNALVRQARESTLSDDVIKTIAALVGDKNSQVRISSTNLINIVGDKAASQVQ